MRRRSATNGSGPTAGQVVVAAAGWHDESPGGANKLPTDFARYLARRGWDVTYVCAGLDERERACERVDGVDVRRYPKPMAPSPSLANLRAHVAGARRIVRAAARRGAVRAVLGHAQLQYLGAIAGAGRRARRCFGVHSPFVEELKANHTADVGLKQRIAWTVARIIEARIYARSDVVHCDSAYSLDVIRAQYARSLNDKGIVLPGWVDTARFTPGPMNAARTRARLGPPWDPATTTFVTLRRLVPRMGLDTLIDAARILAGEGRIFRLVVGGDGPARGDLEDTVRSRGLEARVAFLGRVPDTDVVGVFRAADCFVLPTRTLECFGLIILESFACGIPVIATPVGSIREVMGESLRPWLAADNSAPALAATMRQFMDGALRVDGITLRDRARAFDVEHLAPRHERVLLDADTAGLDVEQTVVQAAR